MKKNILWKYNKYIQVITELQKMKAALPHMRLATSKPFLNGVLLLTTFHRGEPRAYTDCPSCCSTTHFLKETFFWYLNRISGCNMTLICYTLQGH